MAIVVVGGHSRNVGKTTVTAAVIRAFSGRSWTAIKISSHWHGENAAAEASNKESLFRILEEKDRHGPSDTSRFLAAGASRALWIQVRKDGLSAAMDIIHPVLFSNPCVIIEGNTILRFINPDLRIFVLRYDVEDFKDSAHEMLRQADAAVAMGPRSSSPWWEKAVSGSLSAIPLFTAEDPLVVPEEFIRWMEARLA